MTQGTNDNQATPPGVEPDAHGQAALMLAESMLHTLMETGAFTPEQAVSAVTTAQEIKVEFAHLAGESQKRMQASLDLLTTIAGSIKHEIT